MATGVFVEDGEEYFVDTIIAADAMKYIGTGTGSTAADKSDTDVETTDGENYATGVMSEADASTIQVVGTISYTGSHTLRELVLKANSDAGPLCVRSVFDAVNVENGDSVEWTFQIELT